MMGMRRFQHVTLGSVGGLAWMRCHGPCPSGLIIALPLIGGHALQQLRVLRPLVRRKFDLLSFNYSGHGESKGTFSIRASMENSEIALGLAMDQSRREGLPLYGIASCFSAIPMLNAAHQRGEPMDKIVLINALPSLHWEKMVVQFIRYWRYHGKKSFALPSLAEALRAYRDELLPNVSHAPQGFGILPRHRIHWFHIFQDLIALRHSEAKPIASTPVLCVYGRQDRLLTQFGFPDWQSYEATIESICPGTRFLRIDGDHFLSGVDVRRGLLQAVSRFLLL
jgi:pimeloyl-ACP methyl ester carboxylesterase